MLNSFDDLLDFARVILNPVEFHELLTDNPAHHAPIWHVHGVLGHLYSVYEAGKHLSSQTGVDISQAALYHDLGKLCQFSDALALYEKGKQPDIAYAGHELKSAGLAGSDGMRLNSVNAIAHHNLAYRDATPEAILLLLGNKHALVEWMVLCASDAAGKGFTTAQNKQRRHAIPDRFRQVAKLADIDPYNPVVVRCCDAVRYWQPVLPPKFF